MTLDDLEHQNREFYVFFGDFGLRDTFEERIAPKSVKIDMEKLHMKLSALNTDFDGPSLDFLGSRKPAHKGIRERYPLKSRYFTVVGQSFMKMVADRHGHVACHNKHCISDELFRHINIDDLKKAVAAFACEKLPT